MPKTKFICEHCGKEFERWASKYPNGIAKYCSLKCNGASKKDKETTYRHNYICEYCGKEFLMKDSRINKANHHFCSYECSNKFRQNRSICTCENCGKEFERKKSIKELGYARFCSWECRSIFLKGKNHFCFKSEKRICPICKKEFYPRPSEVFKGKGLYCSKPCWYKSMMLEKPSDSKHFYGTSFWINLREECYKRDNYTCQRCGATNVKLDAHHIIPRTFKGKDELENLISLCSSCHHKIEIETRKKLKITRFKQRAE